MDAKRKQPGDATENGSPRLAVDALAAIERAKAALPRLCRYGMLWGPDQDCDERFSVEGVTTALIYLSQFQKQDKPRWSSYLLKHLAERWGCDNELDCYVANGEMIVAAVALDLPIKWEGGGPNVTVGIKLPRKDVRRAVY